MINEKPPDRLVHSQISLQGSLCFNAFHVALHIHRKHAILGFTWGGLCTQNGFTQMYFPEDVEGVPKIGSASHLVTKRYAISYKVGPYQLYSCKWTEKGPLMAENKWVTGVIYNPTYRGPPCRLSSWTLEIWADPILPECFRKRSDPCPLRIKGLLNDHGC